MKILKAFYSTVMSSYQPKDQIDMVCFLIEKFNFPIDDMPLELDDIESLYKKYYFIDYCNKFGFSYLFGLKKIVKYYNSL